MFWPLSSGGDCVQMWGLRVSEEKQEGGNEGRSRMRRSMDDVGDEVAGALMRGGGINCSFPEIGRAHV